MSIHKHIVRTLSCAVVAAPFLMAQAGSISGNVVAADSGNPLAGVAVTISSYPNADSKVVDTKPYSGGITTGADGAFSFKGLPAGLYRICAQPPGNVDLAESCLGTDVTGRVTLAAGQDVRAVSIRLAKGFRIRVRLEDPQSLLKQSTGKLTAAPFELGVWLGFTYRALIPTKAEDLAYEFELTAPLQTGMRLSLVSSSYALADAQGKTIENREGAKADINVASAVSAPPQYVFRLMPKKAQ